jgi:excisionase family DNA binding protein
MVQQEVGGMSSAIAEKAVMKDEELYPHQVQARLVCSRSMVYKLLNMGEIQGRKVGCHWRITALSVRRYLDRQGLAAQE